ncbi:hypothetical protein WH47_02353 [Habropoda laboriosa]|uniref:Uncharacterized protein n=1 Tax=Habropoda laboriosa TaxID=597456 RepID=A0A0L7RKA7_9HYME|nr:hypothetical protein WH47_02353 [Habropoda laboriosa]
MPIYTSTHLKTDNHSKTSARDTSLRKTSIKHLHQQPSFNTPRTSENYHQPAPELLVIRLDQSPPRNTSCLVFLFLFWEMWRMSCERKKRGGTKEAGEREAIRSKLTIDSSETAAWHDPLPRSFPEIDDSVDVKIQSQNDNGTSYFRRRSVGERKEEEEKRKKKRNEVQKRLRRSKLEKKEDLFPRKEEVKPLNTALERSSAPEPIAGNRRLLGFSQSRDDSRHRLLPGRCLTIENGRERNGGNRTKWPKKGNNEATMNRERERTRVESTARNTRK